MIWTLCLLTFSVICWGFVRKFPAKPGKLGHFCWPHIVLRYIYIIIFWGNQVRSNIPSHFKLRAWGYLLLKQCMIDNIEIINDFQYWRDLSLITLKWYIILTPFVFDSFEIYVHNIKIYDNTVWTIICINYRDVLWLQVLHIQLISIFLYVVQS